MTERQRDEEDEGCSAAVGIFIKYSRSADDVVCVTVDIFVKCTLCADYVAGNAFNYADDDANC